MLSQLQHPLAHAPRNRPPTRRPVPDVAGCSTATAVSRRTRSTAPLPSGNVHGRRSPPPAPRRRSLRRQPQRLRRLRRRPARNPLQVAALKHRPTADRLGASGRPPSAHASTATAAGRRSGHSKRKTHTAAPARRARNRTAPTAEPQLAAAMQGPLPAVSGTAAYRACRLSSERRWRHFGARLANCKPKANTGYPSTSTRERARIAPRTCGSRA